MANPIPWSQRMASFALSVIRCIDYLAYGTIFTRAMFLPKKKGDVFFPARKAADERWGVVKATQRFFVCFFVGVFLAGSLVHPDLPSHWHPDLPTDMTPEYDHIPTASPSRSLINYLFNHHISQKKIWQAPFDFSEIAIYWSALFSFRIPHKPLAGSLKVLLQNVDNHS